jgi:hypothetical protein
LTDPGSLFFSCLAVTVPVLAATICLIGRNWAMGQAFICGFAFSVPIVFVCFRLPNWYPDEPLFAGEFKTFAWVALVISPASMVVAAISRKNTALAHGMAFPACVKRTEDTKSFLK